jgi:hypothetical protein
MVIVESLLIRDCRFLISFACPQESAAPAHSAITIQQSTRNQQSEIVKSTMGRGDQNASRIPIHARIGAPGA